MLETPGIILDSSLTLPKHLVQQCFRNAWCLSLSIAPYYCDRGHLSALAWVMEMLWLLYFSPEARRLAAKPKSGHGTLWPETSVPAYCPLDEVQGLQDGLPLLQGSHYLDSSFPMPLFLPQPRCAPS